jgi:hypothetical protein
MPFADKVIGVLELQNGLPDRAIAGRLGCTAQQVNAECHFLEQRGKLGRRKGEDGIVCNVLLATRPQLKLV